MPDGAQASALGNGASVSSAGTRADGDVWASGAESDSEVWWHDADGDLDPEQARVKTEFTLPAAGQTVGGFALAYLERYDRGDTVDYIYAAANLGVGNIAGVTTGVTYTDYQRDVMPGRSGQSANNW